MSFHAEAMGLVKLAEDIAVQIALAERGNNSANQRARTASVDLRLKYKELRKKLLHLEHENTNKGGSK
mgnify:CR=1 FL=1